MDCLDWSLVLYRSTGDVLEGCPRHHHHGGHETKSSRLVLRFFCEAKPREMQFRAGNNPNLTVVLCRSPSYTFKPVRSTKNDELNCELLSVAMC
jgi:hypothetical protein